MSNPKVVVAQLGARKHYQEPLLFHRWGILDRFYTDFYSGYSGVTNVLRYPTIYARLPNFFKKGLDRYEPGLKNAKVFHFPLFGYRYVEALKKAPLEKASQLFIWGGQEFCQRILKHGLGNIDTIYGFNSACLELFEYAKPRGIRCILDQTLADWSLVHQLLLEEERIWKGWSLSPFTINDADIELLEREHREQNLADHIICGSSFVKDSLRARGVDAHKISVAPLGRGKDEHIPPRKAIQAPKQRNEDLKILFVGSVGLRKGIPYLLEALRLLKGEIPFTCKVAGSVEINAECVASYTSVCDFLGRVPRSQIKELYAWADVFVLPSICEGSAMVTYEALSLGVPVITTYNSGSVVRNGIDGFIVPIRDTKAIADKLVQLYTDNRLLEEVPDTGEYLKNLRKDSEKKLLEIVKF